MPTVVRGGRPRLLARARADIVECVACPRLRDHCHRVALEKKRAHREDTYWGRPVPGFGDPAARILVLGLAPAAHGANRTGRAFTGDAPGGSSDFLMAALHRARWASLPTSRSADDGLSLREVYVSIAVRCAPPDNAPMPEEVARCLPHLAAEVRALPQLQTVVALGRIAFDAWLQLLAQEGQRVRPKSAFAHGSVWTMPDGRTLIGSYHPSRQNTNTGRLTPAMFDDVFRLAARSLRTPRL